MKKILGIISIMLIAITFAGCAVNDTKPEAAIDNMFEKYRNKDDNVITQLKETIENEVMNDENKAKYQELMEKQYDRLAYVIKSVKEDKDTATATVELTVLDYKSAILEAEQELENDPSKFNDHKGEYSEDKFTKRKLELMEKVDDTITETVELSLSKKANMWQVDDLSDEDIKKIHGLY